MPRPIWNGTLSFGLLQVPVQLMPGERSTDLHFRMLDGRTKSPIRYERVNAETGEEVPWKEIVKAYEYAKGSYAIVDEKELKRVAPESTETIDIEAFVDAEAIAISRNPTCSCRASAPTRATCCCAKPCAVPARSASRGS